MNKQTILEHIKVIRENTYIDKVYGECIPYNAEEPSKIVDEAIFGLYDACEEQYDIKEDDGFIDMPWIDKDSIHLHFDYYGRVVIYFDGRISDL